MGRWQISLRSVLVGVFGVSIVLACLIRGASIRSRSVRHLAGFGVDVWSYESDSEAPFVARSFHGPYRSDVGINIGGRSHPECDYTSLKYFPKVIYLSFDNTDAIENVLRNVSDPLTVRTLCIANSDITHASIVEMKRYQSLERLTLYRCKIDADDFQVLQNLQGLVHLSLAECRDLGDSHVKQIVTNLGSQVSEMDLSGTAVTDNGLADVCKIRRLETLNVSGTAINGSGLMVLDAGCSLKELYANKTNILAENIGHLLALKTNDFRLHILGTPIHHADIPEFVERWGRVNVLVGR